MKPELDLGCIPLWDLKVLRLRSRLSVDNRHGLGQPIPPQRYCHRYQNRHRVGEQIGRPAIAWGPCEPACRPEPLWSIGGCIQAV